ncbi:hypothetical protein J2W14_000214 [Pseudarthrobacter oxydans]|nr:hypothetical protein [Pseudarthrobacter oxydans]
MDCCGCINREVSRRDTYLHPYLEHRIGHLSKEFHVKHHRSRPSGGTVGEGSPGCRPAPLNRTGTSPGSLHAAVSHHRGTRYDLYRKRCGTDVQGTADRAIGGPPLVPGLLDFLSLCCREAKYRCLLFVDVTLPPAPSQAQVLCPSLAGTKADSRPGRDAVPEQTYQQVSDPAPVPAPEASRDQNAPRFSHQRLPATLSTSGERGHTYPEFDTLVHPATDGGPRPAC